MVWSERNAFVLVWLGSLSAGGRWGWYGGLRVRVRVRGLLSYGLVRVEDSVCCEATTKGCGGRRGIGKSGWLRLWGWVYGFHGVGGLLSYAPKGVVFCEWSGLWSLGVRVRTEGESSALCAQRCPCQVSIHETAPRDRERFVSGTRPAMALNTIITS